MSEYRRQLKILEQNISNRRNIRQAELARARQDRALREREIKALEQIGRQASEPVQIAPFNCVRDYFGNLNCR